MPYDFDYRIVLNLLAVASCISIITITFIQKTKGMIPNRKYIQVYAFFVNMVISVLFCLSFTNIPLISSLWVGLFCSLGADELYLALEGKLKSYSEIIKPKTIEIPIENKIEVLEYE